MQAIGEMGSAVRSRVRFQELPASESDSVDSAGSESNGGGNEGFELKEDPSFWKDHNVQVVIRIRPLSSTEISLQGHNKCVRQESCQTVTWTGHPESRFTFDLVADEHVSQEKLFKVAGVPMVENCVSGYNSCMFAYGQTGSGKTHTMLGDIEGGTRRHSVNCGMTPRVFEYMFSRIQKEKEARRDEKIQFTCKCSFLEIYNEQILDLLDPSSANLQLREDAKKGVHVENLMEFEVSSARDVMQQLIQGAANRKVAATNMNRASSRSHSVFTCVIESKWEAQGVTHHRFARLNLVDLAGSERQKSSGAEGDRLKEATNINKSLSTLGLVIMNLVSSSSKKPMHVPYRDSKLTFLLQDSLGGNSKTIIIANISPSNCCALETLSTLKFAQRAKFIRNNAIVNEDASGDVLAMRLQIQQLKKEVNHLQGLVTGGTENFGCDSLSALHPVSPGNFRWDGIQGSFSPLTFDKRLSQKKEYEAALVAAFRRDQDKEAALKALAAGKQSAEQLANQRTEEVRSLKMRLRFREEGIKRLEAINSGKLSAETHLLREREELLKEVEVLRNQGDRNPEVTRFAMENLQLKEELRRLQAFVEEGEREMLNEQITILQDKLLEALDWKLMHEKDTDVVQDRLSLTWDTSDNEEAEFLRLQAIQNQREVEALRKNLTFCLEAKEKLERRVDELVSQLKEQTSSFDAPNLEIQNFQNSGPVSAEANGSTDDQLELKTMVDAIAAASQREAEAHETAIMLAKENEELREKIKVLIEDNNQLIELYDGVVAGGASKQPDSGCQINHTREQANNSSDYTANGHENSNCENYYQETRDIEHLQHQLHEMHEENEKLLGLYEKVMQEKEEKQVHMDIEHLQHQLHEMHEENDKLLGLYEKAMQEKDELKKLLSSYDFNGTEAKEEIKCEEKLVRMDVERDAGKQDREKLEELLALYEKAMQERDECKRNLSFYELNSVEAKDEMKHEEIPVHMDDERAIQMHEKENLEELSEEKLCLVRTRLDQVQDQLESAGKAVKYFGLLEKATFEVDELRDTIEGLNQTVQLKQQELTAVRSILPKTLERRTVAENKFLAIKVALQNVSSKVQYWDKREEQAREKVKMCSWPLEQKKEELRHLKIRKDEADGARMRARLSESELRDNIASLKLKYQAAEAQKKETERVLFAIDNNPDLSLQRTTNFGKASEMLKSEEERSKISAEIKQQRERLATVMKEIADSKRISEALDSMIQSLEAGIECGMCSLQEAELRLKDVLAEKQVLSEMREDGMESELSKILLEYQERIFESDLKEEEIKLLDETLQLEVINLEELTAKQLCATHKLNYLLEESRHNLMFSNSDKCSRSVSEKIEIELAGVQRSLADAKSLLLSVR